MAFVDPQSGAIHLKLVAFGPDAAANSAFVRTVASRITREGKPLEVFTAEGNDDVFPKGARVVWTELLLAAGPRPLRVFLYAAEGDPEEMHHEYLMRGLDGIVFLPRGGAAADEASSQMLRRIVEGYAYPLATAVVEAKPDADPIAAVESAIREVFRILGEEDEVPPA